MYIIKRIIHIDYKNFIKTVKEIHDKTKKPYLFLYFDILICAVKYGSGYMDYKIFAMYNLNSNERKNIITRSFNNSLVKKYNDVNSIHLFKNKNEFNAFYNDYLNRDWLYLDDFNEYKRFVNKYHKIVIKPNDSSCGTNVRIIEATPDLKNYNILKENSTLLLEEVITQNDEINKIYPLSINTIRVVTLNGKIMMAFFRIGNNGNVVDNFNHGGMVATIDILTGIVSSNAIDKKGNTYEMHPFNNKTIKGFTIPYWKDVIKLCEEVSHKCDKVNYVGWDIAIGNNKLYLVEGNEFPGHDIYELPIFQTNKVGHKDLFLHEL